MADAPFREDPPRDDPALVAEALRNPSGWIYVIEGDFGPDDAVPPTAIRGAWKVDDAGLISGDFIPNPRFAGGDSPSIA